MKLGKLMLDTENELRMTFGDRVFSTTEAQKKLCRRLNLDQRVLYNRLRRLLEAGLLRQVSRGSGRDARPGTWRCK